MIFRCSSTLRLLPTPLRIIPSEFSQTKDLQRIKQAGWNMHNCLLQFMPCTIFTEESFTAFLWFGAHQGGYNSSQVAYRNNIKHTHKVRSKWDVKPFKTIMDLKLKLILVKRDSIFLSLFLWFFFSWSVDFLTGMMCHGVLEDWKWSLFMKVLKHTTLMGLLTCFRLHVHLNTELNQGPQEEKKPQTTQTLIFFLCFDNWAIKNW